MAPRLSPAQQAALLGIPVRRDFIPEHTGFRWATLACLKSLRLIKGEGYGKKARHVITATGLKLRAELARRESDERLCLRRAAAQPEGRQRGAAEERHSPHTPHNPPGSSPTTGDDVRNLLHGERN